MTGETLRFSANVYIPENAGEFVAAEFSFEGETDYPYKAGRVSKNKVNGLNTAVVDAEHVFKEAGTYFCVVRIVSNRNQEDGYTRLRNLSRVRVVVEA